MKTRYIYILAAFAVLASCAKEIQETEIESPAETSLQKTILTVGLDGTKTYMGTSESGFRKVYWSNGDKIAVNGVASEALSGLADDTESTQFTFNGVLNAPYSVIYPASIYKDATHVTLPAVQTYKADGFADGMFPMAGYTADGSSISLTHLCSIVKVSIKRETAAQAQARGGDVDTDKIVAVRFSGNNSEKVSGEIAIDYSTTPTPSLTAASGSGEDLVVSVAKSQSTSTSTAKDYYLVVPARNYSSGFTITVKDANGHIMTKSKSSSWEPEAGKLYKMPTFEFVPSATELGIEISNAQELIDFATAYNNHEFDNLGDDVLIATITDNITFDATTSASFNITGGIGKKDKLFGASEDYYFNGLFNGDGYTISGLTATVPLFAAIGGAGHVYDFTLDDSCSFTFTHPNTTELDAGAVVGYHRGEVKDVDVEADVSLVAGEVSQETCLGGIAGRITEGLVDNCSYSGAITIPAGFHSAAKKIQIGGIVGRISNASGKVQNTDFEGTIDNQGQLIASSETSDFKNYPQLMIGGIAGLNSGTLDNCSVANHTTGVSVSLTDDSDSSVHEYTGSIVTHSSNAYHYAIAGIVGRNDGTTNDCTNNATVLNVFSAARGTSGNMNGRYLEVGGIAGYNAEGKSVTGCNNYGAIIDRANPKVQYVGGLVGSNGGTVSSSSNNSTGTITVDTSHLTPYGARILYCGGNIGYNQNTGAVSNISNTANITISRTEDIAGTIVWVGGISGGNDAAIDGTANSGSISNSGKISITNANTTKCSTPTDDNDYGFFIGGIVARSSAAVKNVSNSGNLEYNCTAAGVGVQYVYLGGITAKVLAASTVDIEKCSNSGNLTFVPDETAPHSGGAVYNYCYLGGIAGYAKNANIKGDSSTKCTNSGTINGGEGLSNQNATTPQNSFWVGGIVGYLTGASSISYCELTGGGQSKNNHWCNRGSSWKTNIGTSMYTAPAPANGGIAGEVIGTNASRITISNCSIASTATIWSRRGACGGIVGLTQYADVSNCTVPVNISNGYWNGGIVAAAYQTSVSSCNYTGASVAGANESGGIVGYLDAGSSITSCNSYATSLTTSALYGGIAGASVSGTSIKSSHCKTGKQICSDSNFSAGTGAEANAADL